MQNEHNHPRTTQSFSDRIKTLSIEELVALGGVLRRDRDEIDRHMREIDEMLVQRRVETLKRRFTDGDGDGEASVL